MLPISSENYSIETTWKWVPVESQILNLLLIHIINQSLKKDTGNYKKSCNCMDGNFLVEYRYINIKPTAMGEKSTPELLHGNLDMQITKHLLTTVNI